MKSKTKKSFRDLLKQLPKAIRVQARVSYKLFLLNPQHPGLRFKLVKYDPVVYSARVGQSYRALGYLEGDRITWYWIGSHTDYDKELKKL